MHCVLGAVDHCQGLDYIWVFPKARGLPSTSISQPVTKSAFISSVSLLTFVDLHLCAHWALGLGANRNCRDSPLCLFFPSITCTKNVHKGQNRAPENCQKAAKE